MANLISINPATEEAYGELPETKPLELKAIIERAKSDKTWPNTSIEERVKQLAPLPELLVKHQEIIAQTMAGEIGKPIKAGRHEVEIAAKRIESYLTQIPSFIADEVLFEDEREQNLVSYEPPGSALVISPWNAPVFVSLASLFPPLLCGNNVIWKPSEYASFTAKALIPLFDELKKQGLPNMAIQVAFGGKEVGRTLVESDVDAVAVTGSVRAGKEIMKSSAEHLHRLVLELGGKDPAIVLDDANLQTAAREIVKVTTMYAGQVCFGVERVYCSEKIFEPFLAECKKEMGKLVTGNPFDEKTDVGPLSVKFQFEKVLTHIDDALKKGAKLHCGGKWLGGKGYFIAPGILIDVDHSMLIMKEETFGPVLPIMKFSNIEEAVGLANDSRYGLTASIWTGNLKKGKEIARRIEAGTVEINRHGMSKAGCPWGGSKDSGLGRIYSRDGMRTFTNIKHIWTIKS